MKMLWKQRFLSKGGDNCCMVFVPKFPKKVQLLP